MSARRYRVLVADRSSESRERSLRALAERGFACDTAEDGEQALQMLGRTPYDILLTDVVLPKLHGHTLILRAQQMQVPPRTVVLSDLCDPRLVRDLLSRGIDDYLHKSLPGELLAMKLLALFELDKWRAGQQAADIAPAEMDRDTLLGRIEQQLETISSHYADQLIPLFEMQYAVPELPPAICDFVERLATEERAESAADVTAAANVRASQRAECRTVATAIQVDQRFHATDTPVRLIIRDVSVTGVRMMHTRAIPATDMVLAWRAETLPCSTFRVPLRVTRCRPVGRFYDIGGQFEVPAELATAALASASQPIAVTS